MDSPMFDHPDIRLKRIYEPPGSDDGARVLVDRLWPRAVSKAAARLDLWLKEVAPSPALRKWFGHDPSRFAAFAHRYRAELTANEDVVIRIEELLTRGRVTLVYAAHDTAHNHALVLADYLRERNADLLAQK